MIYRSDWEQFKVNIPEGKLGNWEVVKFEVNEKDAEKWNFHSLLSFSSRKVVPGWFTKLTYKDHTIMSDTKDEILDHWDIIKDGFGHCLVNGLGLGMVTQALLNKENVSKVTVIEIAPEVIQLVGTHYKQRYGDKLEIIQADALVWKPKKGVKFDCAWHDIWPSICTDNLPDMKLLHRRYGRRVTWQASWGREILKAETRRFGW